MKRGRARIGTLLVMPLIPVAIVVGCSGKTSAPPELNDIVPDGTTLNVPDTAVDARRVVRDSTADTARSDTSTTPPLSDATADNASPGDGASDASQVGDGGDASDGPNEAWPDPDAKSDPTSCHNSIKDWNETDVDCGGICIKPCTIRQGCRSAADCDTLNCTLRFCNAPTCNDLAKNGNETDVDCGGSQCNACADGKACTTAADCLSLVCPSYANICLPPACNDGVLNGDETDVDCGGGCTKKCQIGARCKAGTDCRSKNCDGTGQCACLDGMVTVPVTGLGTYCIDQTEVSNADYSKFINANPPLLGQPAQCQWNTTYIPSRSWPPIPAGMTLAVRYVDWCDAQAYCAWNAKRLCGTIDGRTLDYTDFDKPLKSAWHNACTAQGVNIYPYGATYMQCLCNGPDWFAYWEYQWEVAYPNTRMLDYTIGGPQVWHPQPSPSPRTEPECYPIPYTPATSTTPAITLMTPATTMGNGTKIWWNQACQGGVVGLYEMSGNVAEWEDSCQATVGAADLCHVRGGSMGPHDPAIDYNYSTSGAPPPVPTDDPNLRCDANRPVARNTQAYDIGFRCCL